MTWYGTVVVAPLIGLAAYTVVHVTYNRLTRGRKLLTGFVIGLLAGWITEIAISLRAVSDGQPAWIDAASLVVVNQLAYLALAYGYVNFVNILMTSLRLRILHELLAAENGLTAEEMSQRYNARDLVGTRLRRLTSSNHLRCENGRYYSRFTSLLLIAKFSWMLKSLLLGTKK